MITRRWRIGLDLADYLLHYGADSMALHDTLPAGERVIVAFGENASTFGRIVALPAGLEDAVWMQNTLVLPDRGGMVSVSHVSGAEIDALAYGDFDGLSAENAYIADTLLDSMSRRSSLKSVQRASYGGASEREGSVGDIDPGLQTERSEQAEVGSFYLNRGRKVYELTNHLGNVLAVVSDVKLGVSTSSVVDYYIADVVEMTDYELFGMELANRCWVSSDRYRFAFQGQEGDDEWNGEGNMLAFKYRVHDVRLGRFLSVDPLAAKYPYNSPYAFAENKVGMGVELEGLELTNYEIYQDYHLNDPEYAEANLRIHSSGMLEVAMGTMVVDILVTRGMIGETLMTLEMYNIYRFGNAIREEEAKGNIEGANNLRAEAEFRIKLLVVAASADVLFQGLAMGGKYFLGDPLVELPAVEIVSQEENVINLKYKSEWNAQQRLAADQKVDYLNNCGDLVVTKPPKRQSGLRSRFQKAGNTVSNSEHVDHSKDLQLSGKDELSNTKALDASVNCSLGKQIDLQVKRFPLGTKIHKVTIPD